MKARPRKQRTFSHGSVEEGNESVCLYKGIILRPEGRAGGGCEMRWGNRKSSGIIRRWRGN